MTFDYKCPKCANETYRLAELRGSSGGLSAFLDWDTAIYTTVSCEKCLYSELYACSSAEFEQRILGLPDPLSDPGRPAKHDGPAEF